MEVKQFTTGILFALVLLTLVIIPVAHQQGSGTYDPWLDFDDDGTIDANELYPLGQSYGSTGDPTKNVRIMNSDYEWGEWRDLLAYENYYFYNDTRGYREVSITIRTNATIGVNVVFYPGPGINGPAVEVDYFLHTGITAIHKTYPVISGQVYVLVSNPDPATANYGLYLYMTT